MRGKIRNWNLAFNLKFWSLGVVGLMWMNKFDGLCGCLGTEKGWQTVHSVRLLR